MSKANIIKVYCNRCSGDTNHSIKRKLEDQTEIYDNEDQPLVVEYSTYLIIQCRGCDRISFLQADTHNKGEDIANADFLQQFPSIVYGFDNEIFLSDDEQAYLPKFIYYFYNEVVNNFKDENLILAGIGLRMLLEAVCKHQKAEGRTLVNKVKYLETAGYISQKDHPILDKLRLIGNVSAHEIKSLPYSKLVQALQIINHALKSIYIIHKTGSKLKVK